MRHVEITHKYVLAVDEDDVETLDPIVNAGVSMMERVIQNTAKSARDIHSDWALMPKEYSATHLEDEERIPGRAPKRYDQDPNMTEAERERDSILSKRIIEADADGGINLTGDVFGQRGARAMHPWDQGLSIFPEDHPYRWIEDHFREKGDREALDRLQADAPKMKELPSG